MLQALAAGCYDYLRERALSTQGKPLIGITGRKDTSARLLHTSMHSVGATYIRAVQRAGGTPVMVPPVMHETDWPVLLERLDGLLLSGGEDIAPTRYGQMLEPYTNRIDEERDFAELGLVRAWLMLDKPLLGICRGHQLLNVALGGTLFQDIMTQVANALDHADVPARPMENSVHDVDIRAGCALARILGEGTSL